MVDGGRFSSAADALSFALAGNARLTLASKRTGARFTFRIRRNDERALWFVDLLVGPSNEVDYRPVGVLLDGGKRFSRSRRLKASDAPSLRAFGWAFARLALGVLPDLLEVWHEGRCGRCGRPLTVPASVATGFGPECAARAGSAA